MVKTWIVDDKQTTEPLYVSEANIFDNEQSLNISLPRIKKSNIFIFCGHWFI